MKEKEMEFLTFAANTKDLDLEVNCKPSFVPQSLTQSSTGSSIEASQERRTQDTAGDHLALPNPLQAESQVHHVAGHLEVRSQEDRRPLQDFLPNLFWHLQSDILELLSQSVRF